MNCLETGLPHTKFSPSKTMFSPPRLIPLCTLGRKYLGLEPVPKREIDCLTRRLCQPKKFPELVDPVRYVRPASSGTGRFVGEKRMSNNQIEKMVARLCNRRSAKTEASADETVDGSHDLSHMSSRADVTNDSDEENKMIANDGMDANDQRLLAEHRKEGTFDEAEHDLSHKPGLKRSHNSTVGLKVHVDNFLNTPNVHQRQNCVPARDERPEGRKKDFGSQSEKILVDVRPMYDVSNVSYRREIRSGQTRRAEVVGKSSCREYLSRPNTTQTSTRSSWTSKLDPSKSPRDKLQKVDDEKHARQVATPCEESLIDTVATYNRSLRPQAR